MKKYFLDLFEYNNWANDRIIVRLQKVADQLETKKPLIILSHIIASQDTWLERLKETKSYNIYLWDEYSVQELGILSLESHKNWIKFITKLDDKSFSNICNYKNTKGKKFSKNYQDIFQHVINHSSYHRGQINQIFRSNNIDPVVTDFIYYC